MNKASLHIIYLPGFGDDYDIGRRLFLWCWRIFGVTTEFIPMHWNSNESYAEKLARIDIAIDRAASRRIVVIGESAGGSLVLPVYAKRTRDLYKVMTISGKNNNSASVAPRLYAKHVAFRESMRATELALEQIDDGLRRRFIAFYPLYDDVIPLQEAIIPGCKVIRLFSIGHFFTIFLALTLYSGYVIHVAKQRG
jgi:hypothetical protein